MDYNLLKCKRCSPNFSVQHRVEIIQTITGNFAKYTCLSCNLVTRERAAKDVRQTKLHKDSDEIDDEP